MSKKKEQPYWLEWFNYPSVAEMVNDCFRREVVAELERPLVRAIVRRCMNWSRDFEITLESIRAVRYEQRIQICDALYKSLQHHEMLLQDRYYWNGGRRGWELRRERLGWIREELSRFRYRPSDADKWLGAV